MLRYLSLLRIGHKKHTSLKSSILKEAFYVVVSIPSSLLSFGLLNFRKTAVIKIFDFKSNLYSFCTEGKKKDTQQGRLRRNTSLLLKRKEITRKGSPPSRKENHKKHRITFTKKRHLLLKAKIFIAKRDLVFLLLEGCFAAFKKKDTKKRKA